MRESGVRFPDGEAIQPRRRLLWTLCLLTSASGEHGPYPPLILGVIRKQCTTPATSQVPAVDALVAALLSNTAVPGDTEGLDPEEKRADQVLQRAFQGVPVGCPLRRRRPPSSTTQRSSGCSGCKTRYPRLMPAYGRTCIRSSQPYSSPDATYTRLVLRLSLSPIRLRLVASCGSIRYKGRLASVIFLGLEVAW